MFSHHRELNATILLHVLLSSGFVVLRISKFYLPRLDNDNFTLHCHFLQIKWKVNSERYIIPFNNLTLYTEVSTRKLPIPPSDLHAMFFKTKNTASEWGTSSAGLHQNRMKTKCFWFTANPAVEIFFPVDSLP